MNPTTAPTLTPTKATTDPRVTEAIRTWRDAADELEPHRPEASVFRKLDGAERAARVAVGQLLGAPAVVEVDGAMVIYERSTRGAGAPDFEAAWGELCGAFAADPAMNRWAEFALRVLAGHRTPGSTVHTLRLFPTADLQPVAVRKVRP